MLIKEWQFIYEEKGEGEPLIILHGLMGAASNFKEMRDFLSENGFKVFLPKLPLLEFNILQTNITQLKKYLERFINHLGLKNIHLIGNSLGGHLALLYANEHQDNIKSISLLGSSGLYEKSFGSSFPRREDKKYIREKINEIFFDKKIVTDELVEDVFETLNDRMNILKTLSISKSAIRHNMEKDLPNLKIPTCLIWGKNDNVTPPEVAEKFHSLLSNSKLFWIDKCGHAPMMEHPSIVNEIYIDWYKEVFTKKNVH